MHAIRKICALALLLPAISALAGEDAPASLLKQTKVSEADARAAALARVPGGTVKSHDLEKENGRLIWTFDIAAPAVPGLTEVHVDAKTGKVVAVGKESPAQEAKEAKTEKGR